MNKRTIAFTLFAILIVSTLYQLHNTNADITYISRVFLSPLNDGYLRQTGSDYGIAHDALTGIVDSGNSYMAGGQLYTEFMEPQYDIYRSCLFFDTSSIPATAGIINATLSLYIEEIHSDSIYNIIIQHSNSYPHDPIEENDYYYGFYGTNIAGQRSISEAGLGFWNITLNLYGIYSITRAGETRFLIRSSNDLNSIAPFGAEYLVFSSRDRGEAFAPKLYVTYSVLTTTTTTESTIISSTSETTSVSTSTTMETSTGETTSTIESTIMSTSTSETTTTDTSTIETTSEYTTSNESTTLTTSTAFTTTSTLTSTTSTSILTTTSTTDTTSQTSTITQTSCTLSYSTSTTAFTSTAVTTSTITGKGAVHYIIHGPYYESGAVANADVALILTQKYNVTLYFDLDGTDVVADTIDVYLDQPATYLAWNISDVANYTRFYYFQPEDVFDEVWVFVPEPSAPVYPYTFVPTDYAGMTNPFLETSINVNGQIRVVERKKVDINQVTFLMVQWHRYDLTWRCDQGSYTQAFSAENTFTTSLVVLAGAFPISTSSSPVALATRLNETSIRITYADGSESTYWLFLNITHKVGTSYVLDYEINTTGFSYSLTWTLADETTDYIVHIVSYASNKIFSWTYPCIITQINANPFDGLLDFIGDWQGFNAAQIPAAFIIMLFLGIGSFRSAGVCCLLSWIVMVIFVIMGWYAATVPTMGFACATSILIWLAEGKETVREI